MSKPLILIVDDEEQIACGVQVRLRAAGYETMTASDGKEGIAKAKLHHPRAILMDVLMPEMDGMQALERLQADKDTADIPVVMLSASMSDQRTAIDAGARFFVPKPYHGSHLQDALDAVLGAKPTKTKTKTRALLQASTN